MNVIGTDIPGVVLIEPLVTGDSRDYILEGFQAERYEQIGISDRFVQDRHSRAPRGVLRGLHCQLKRPQGKLMRVSRGRILNVAVDVRVGSPTFQRWVAAELDDETHRQMFIPPGLHAATLVLSDIADFMCKFTDYDFPDDEIAVRWNDPDIGVEWPLADPVVSEKDAKAPLLEDIAPGALPAYSGFP